MAITRSQLVKELEPGLNALFGLEYNRYDNEHAEIYATESSDRAFEEEVMLSGFAGAPVKQEGAMVVFDQANEAFTARYSHETIALAFAITEEAIEDNLYDKLAGRYTRALARSMSNTKQVKAAAVLNRAQVTTATGGDGVPLISSAHPLATGGTFSNVLAVAADLNETSLEQSLIDIAGFVDERGLKIALSGRKMIIPKELQFTAERIMKSPLRSATADNDINAIMNMGMVPEGYRVNHFLTDTDSFFLLTDVPNGLKHFVRSPIKTAMEGDFDTGNVRFKARERYSFGFSDPRCIFGNGNLPTS
jgi:CBS domain-containing protein